jgi:hypothetical protein
LSEKDLETHIGNSHSREPNVLCYPYIFALQERIEEFGTHSGDVLMVLGVNVIISAISILEY